MERLSETAKHAGDAAAVIGGVGGLATAVIFWMQVTALAVSILASGLSAAWMIKRFREARKP